MMALLTGILHLGNVKFSADDECSVVDDKDILIAADCCPGPREVV